MNIQSVTILHQNSQSFGQIIPQWKAKDQIQRVVFDVLANKPNEETKMLNILKDISNAGGELPIDLHAHRKRAKDTFQFHLSMPHAKEFEPIFYDKKNPLIFLETLKEQIVNSNTLKQVDAELEELRLQRLAQKAESIFTDIFEKN